MSKHLGPHLTVSLLSRLTSTDERYSDRAIVICTVDDYGHPHPAMLSSGEFTALGDRTIRLVAYAASRTAHHLQARALVTAILADVDGVFYVKAAAVSSREESGRMVFELQVREVLEDTPAPEEGARITSGIRFERAAD